MVGMILSLWGGGKSSFFSFFIQEMKGSEKVPPAPKGAKYDLTRSGRHGNILPPNHSSPQVRPWSSRSGAFCCPPHLSYLKAFYRQLHIAYFDVARCRCHRFSQFSYRAFAIERLAE